MHKPRSANWYRPANKRAPSKASIAERFKSQAIRDELFLISFVILCAGIVFTDSYYQGFGFRYQLLNMSTMHIVYKGLTMVFTSPLMLIPYLLTVAFTAFEFYAFKNNVQGFIYARTPIVLAFIILNLMFCFPLAINAGKRQALIDIHEDTTGLPKINRMNWENNTISWPQDKFLLFYIDDSFVVFFKPSARNSNAYPVIKRIPKSSVTLLDTKL